MIDLTRPATNREWRSALLTWLPNLRFAFQRPPAGTKSSTREFAAKREGIKYTVSVHNDGTCVFFVDGEHLASFICWDRLNAASRFAMALKRETRRLNDLVGKYEYVLKRSAP